MPVREDELAATCMGLNAARLKLAALVVAAGLAGLAGVLYAAKSVSTSTPEAYDFNRSITILCCLILGGLGSRNGVLVGVLVLVGFDNILSQILDDKIQAYYGAPAPRPVAAGGATLFTLPKEMFTFTGWKLAVFGLALILVMRFRPEGLFPSDRVKDEMHPEPRPGTTP